MKWLKKTNKDFTWIMKIKVIEKKYKIIDVSILFLGYEHSIFEMVW